MLHGARARRRRRVALLLAPILWVSAARALQAAIALPAEGACPSVRPLGGPPQDAAPLALREGMRLGHAELLRLEALLPIEVWRNRAQFFAPGTSLEVGACHRRYPVPAFFSKATRELAGRVHLDGDGNLLDHVTGLPFPPEGIDPDAWDLERRYRGAGPSGHFRLVDMPSRLGGIQTYVGSWFLLQLGLRADLAASGYAEPVAPDSVWVAGGRFDVRYAAVIQGALKQADQGFALLTLYVDVQTQQPLYMMTRRRQDGQLAEVGVLLHRFSGDLPRYPRFGDGAQALVFDPVAAVFYDGTDGGSGWRRESYDVTSVPRDADTLRRLTSPSELVRGR